MNNPTQTNETLMSLAANACPECDPPGSGQECRGGPCGHCGGTGIAPFNLGARAREMLAGELGGVQARQALRTTGHFTVDAHAALRAIERALSGLDEAIEALADDEQITELLQEAIERLGQAGWMPGTYKQRLAQFFTAAALKARAHSERTGCEQ